MSQVDRLSGGILPPLVLLLVALLTVSGCGDRNNVGQGTKPGSNGRIGFPLGGPPPNGFADGDARIGEVITGGQLVVFNLGTSDIEVVKVEPEMTGGGLQYLGAQVAGLGRRIGFVQVKRRFPVADSRQLGVLVNAVGARLGPGSAAAKRGFEVLLGFKVTKAGRSTVRGVTVTYRYQGKVHKETWTSTMAVCAGGSPSPCPQEYGDS